MTLNQNKLSSKLKFKSISIRNFLSYGNQDTTISLENQGSVNVLGENLDNSGGNGSGKTVLINALCYALYNKPFGNISLERLINRTNVSKNTQMEVRVLFEKDSCEYEIFRARGGGGVISLTRDGEDITPGKGVSECDNLILNIIGISYELFTRIIIFSGTSGDFLQLPIAKQRGLIEELFRISILSDKAKLLKETINTTTQDIKIAEAVIKHQESANELHKKQIKDAIARVDLWEKQTLTGREHIIGLLERIKEVDFEEEQLLQKEKVKLQQHIQMETSLLQNKKKELTLATSSLEKDLNELEHLTNDKCPYCLQDFKDTENKIEMLNVRITEHTANLEYLEEAISSQDDNLKKAKTELESVSARIKHSDLNELLKAKDNIVANQTKLEQLTIAVNPYIEPLNKLKEQGNTYIETDKLDLLKQHLEHQQFLLKLLTDKNSFLRQKIISKNIPFLNRRLNIYTSQLGLPHIVNFDADMSCTVSEYGRELDFDNLSQGEKKRVSTALMLAFRDVHHHLGMQDNLLFVDELDGGAMDIPGIDAIVKLLKQITRDENLSAFIISHHPAVVGRFDQTLYIRKQHGFSSASFE